MNNPFPLGAHPSTKDTERITSTMVSPLMPSIPQKGKVPLFVNILSNQEQIGECTRTAVRMMLEAYFKDGVKLHDAWNYLIQKIYFDGNLIEGSSYLSALKSAQKMGSVSETIGNKYPLNTHRTYADFISDFQIRYGGMIPAEILADAKARCIPGYYQVTLDPISFANEINKGKILGLRFAVGSNFWTDATGNYSNSAQRVLPYRAPITAPWGHALAMNEYEGLNVSQLGLGPQSWGEQYLPDNPRGAGFYNFIFGTQIPKYVDEAWAIADKIPEIKYHFSNDLKVGSSGVDVTALQKVLVAGGYLTMPQGVAYGNFGSLTNKALVVWQIHNGINGTGYFGPLSRAKMNGSSVSLKPTLIQAMIKTESGGDDHAEGDKGLKDHAYGCLQIRQGVVDAINGYLKTSYRSQDCLGNRSLSVLIFHTYWKVFPNFVTDEDKAKAWNGGPGWKQLYGKLGYEKYTVALDIYWSRVRKNLGL